MIGPLLLSNHSITVTDIFITIFTIIIIFHICDNLVKISVGILQDLTLGNIFLGITKYFLLIIYIAKLFKTFKLSDFRFSPPTLSLFWLLLQLSP